MSTLGGGLKGISPIQTINNYKDSQNTLTRRVLRSSWNTLQAGGKINGRNRIVTPFRAINNSGDFLARQHYVCGGSNQVNADKPGWKNRIGSILSQCDGTGIAAGTGNQRFVADSSDYARFKREQAVNRTYNDSKFGGDQSHGSYVAVEGVRRR